MLIARATCDSGDDFTSVWRKALGEIALHTESQASASPPARRTWRSRRAWCSATRASRRTLSCAALEALAGRGRSRSSSTSSTGSTAPSCRALFTDTIKPLSDRVVPATLVLVGVADTIDELIREHRSVERAIVQVRMPRMARDELAEIARRGIEASHMTIQGLPSTASRRSRRDCPTSRTC